ncbi:TIGR04076 family protein [Desulfovirgula thermocuniculi]|uniref:TIGR04076 family protein n=1 Tax=Desulfovirgula thermocuniculi TaxID=348842 RepID=UPI000429CB3F|nr:TIGR04076 family protein [Desulfovirgula thermocuniculi]
MKVLAEIVEIRGNGHCSVGYKIGERFVFSAERFPALCPWALGALMMPVIVLLHGGKFEWIEKLEDTYWCCPDPNNTVIFRLSSING